MLATINVQVKFLCKFFITKVNTVCPKHYIFMLFTKTKETFVG